MKVERLLKYANKKGENTIVYTKKDYGIGRFYPCGDTKNIFCYQNLYNVIRRLVINGNYTSVDLVNAHPRILAQLCDKYGIKSEFIKEYAEPSNGMSNPGPSNIPFIICARWMCPTSCPMMKRTSFESGPNVSIISEYSTTKLRPEKRMVNALSKPPDSITYSRGITANPKKRRQEAVVRS